MTRRAWLAFAAASLIWGVPYLFIKIAVEHGFTAPALAWGRVALAGERLHLEPGLDKRHRLAAASDLGGHVHAGGTAAEHDHIECAHISPSPSNFESRPRLVRAYLIIAAAAKLSNIFW